MTSLLTNSLCLDERVLFKKETLENLADGIFISQTSHGARVMVDEEGCTAAAYTVMAAAGGAMPPVEEMDFVVDRPFIFVITGDSGLPLFAGIVNEP